MAKGPAVTASDVANTRPFAIMWNFVNLKDNYEDGEKMKTRKCGSLKATTLRLPENNQTRVRAFGYIAVQPPST